MFKGNMPLNAIHIYPQWPDDNKEKNGFYAPTMGLLGYLLGFCVTQLNHCSDPAGIFLCLKDINRVSLSKTLMRYVCKSFVEEFMYKTLSWKSTGILLISDIWMGSRVEKTDSASPSSIIPCMLATQNFPLHCRSQLLHLFFLSLDSDIWFPIIVRDRSGVWKDLEVLCGIRGRI